MPVRLARYSDLETAAQILTVAFWDEDVMGNHMHPKRNEYPRHVLEFWKRGIRADWWDWSHVFVVATTDDGEIVGVANWARIGDFGGALARWDPRRLLKYIAGYYNSISAFFWPDRAANPALLSVFARAKPFIVHHWTGIRARAWSLESIGVKPEYQGKGIGRELVRWGLENARRDLVAASVVAAFGKERFYRACGFEEIVSNVCDGEDNPMAGFKGGALLFKDPVSVD